MPVNDSRLPARMFLRGETYYCWHFDLVRGRRVRRQRSLSRRLAVAIRLQKKLETEAELRLGGLAPEERTVGFASLRALYLQDLGSHASARHTDNVRYALDEWESALDVDRADQVQRSEILRARGEMVASGASNRTANKKVSHLLAMLRWGEVPVPKVEKLPENGRHRRRTRYPLSAEELRQVIASAREIDEEYDSQIPQAHLIEVLVSTGFRLGAATSLPWNLLSRIGEGHALSLPEALAKNGQSLSNPIPTWVADRLFELRRVQARLLSRLPSPGDMILLRPDGRVWTRSGFRTTRRWLDRVLERAGIAKVQPDGRTIDFHAFRHTFCTLLAMDEVDPRIAQSLMGHKSARMTNQVYTDVERMKRAEAVRRTSGLADPLKPRPNGCSTINDER